MTADESGSPVVLVVEDERDLADLYADWLRDRYEVRTAYSGDEATELIDETVDVVLLDRRLPGMSGDEFLEYVNEEGYDCQVAMVSAVDPDFDIVEMGFDDYVVKPVERGDLEAVVERLLSLDTAGTPTQEYFAQLAKKNALEGEKTDAELEGSAEYAALLQSIESFRRNVIALAETYLDDRTGGFSADDAGVYEAGIQKWEQRREDLDESDPLYRTATAEIERYETLLGETKRDSEAREELLELVADGFVAEGFWLDSRIRRALNEVFFDKHTDSLVVERTRLDPENDLSPQRMYEVSQAIREKAKDHLE